MVEAPTSRTHPPELLRLVDRALLGLFLPSAAQSPAVLFPFAVVKVDMVKKYENGFIMDPFVS